MIIRGFYSLVAVMLGFVIWTIVATQSKVIPYPTQVIVSLYKTIESGTLLKDALSSVGRVALGLLIAVPVGFAYALFRYLFPRLGEVSHRWLEVLRPIPPIAWIPIAILLFGITNRSAVFIVVIGAFFPFYYSIVSSISHTPLGMIEVGRMAGYSQLEITFRIVLPSISSRLFSGLSIASGTAWTSVIAAEMVGSTSGIGHAIQLNRLLLRSDTVIAYMIVTGIVGVCFSGLFSRISRLV